MSSTLQPDAPSHTGETDSNQATAALGIATGMVFSVQLWILMFVTLHAIL